jgi:hypothetical protein
LFFPWFSARRRENAMFSYVFLTVFSHYGKSERSTVAAVLGELPEREAMTAI